MFDSDPVYRSHKDNCDINPVSELNFLFAVRLFTYINYRKKSNKWIKEIFSRFFINYSYKRINLKKWFFIICFLLKVLNEFVLNLKWYIIIIKSLNLRSAGKYKKHSFRANWNNETSCQTLRQLSWTLI